MFESSIFPSREPLPQYADCLPAAPDVAIYYDGTSGLVPVLRSGVIFFEGGVSTRAAGGIGETGDGAYFGVPFDTIKKGGAGVRQRCAVVSTKQKLRLRINPAESVESVVSLELKPLSTCQSPQQFEWELPLWVPYRKGTIETPCQKLTYLAMLFNSQFAHLGKATLVQEVAGYALDIETLKAGDRFEVLGHGGMLRPVVVVPGTPVVYTPAVVNKWFGVAAPVGGVRATELFTIQDIDAQLLGSLTSNLAQSARTQMRQQQTVTVMFSDGADAARTALITILNKDADQYVDRMLTTGCTDSTIYPFSVVRTDAGTDANTATVKSDYSAVSIARVGYQNGKSYYTITLGTSVAPAAVANSGDVITLGEAQLVYGGFVSACPAPV